MASKSIAGTTYSFRIVNNNVNTAGQSEAITISIAGSSCWEPTGNAVILTQDSQFVSYSDFPITLQPTQIATWQTTTHPNQTYCNGAFGVVATIFDPYTWLQNIPSQTPGYTLDIIPVGNYASGSYVILDGDTNALTYEDQFEQDFTGQAELFTPQQLNSDQSAGCSPSAESNNAIIIHTNDLYRVPLSVAQCIFACGPDEDSCPPGC